MNTSPRNTKRTWYTNTFRTLGCPLAFEEIKADLTAHFSDAQPTRMTKPQYALALIDALLDTIEIQSMDAIAGFVDLATYHSWEGVLPKDAKRPPHPVKEVKGIPSIINELSEKYWSAFTVHGMDVEDVSVLSAIYYAQFCAYIHVCKPQLITNEAS